MFSLPTILKINALSSGATGLGLVFFAKTVATIFSVSTTAPFMAVGLFLVVFAAFVFLVAVQKSRNEDLVRTVIWLDRLWVLASIAAIFLLAGMISVMGNVIIGAVAIWVAAMAVLQSKGLEMKNAEAY